MSGDRSGGEEHLAPVIPLFGGRSNAPDPDDAGADAGTVRAERARSALADAERATRRRAAGPETPDRAAWPLERSGETARDRADAGDQPMRIADHPSRSAGHSRGTTGNRIRHLRAAPSRSSQDEAPNADRADADPASVRAQAEDALVRKLRAKQLSVAEARSVLRESDLDRDAVEEVIDEFERSGYLDDRTLASLLVTSAVERKGQGRVAIARSLAQRGIPRAIIDEALAELPDDDEDRALEFARSKAARMTGLEYDTALRRLIGQLARRGYSGSSAMTAARTALAEAGVSRSSGRFPSRAPGRSSGVRFTESD